MLIHSRDNLIKDWEQKGKLNSYETRRTGSMYISTFCCKNVLNVAMIGTRGSPMKEMNEQLGVENMCNKKTVSTFFKMNQTKSNPSTTLEQLICYDKTYL